MLIISRSKNRPQFGSTYPPDSDVARHSAVQTARQPDGQIDRQPDRQANGSSANRQLPNELLQNLAKVSPIQAKFE